MVELLSVQQASQMSGLNPLLIRTWLIQEKVDWGMASKRKGSSQYRYHVFRKPFERWLEEMGVEREVTGKGS